jgi:methionyl-tRNA formyltransferase
VKVFLCGTRYFGQSVFEAAAAAGHEVIGVSAPVGDRLHKAAVRAGVPHVIAAGTLNADTMPEGADLIVAAHSHDFIGAATLRKTVLGGIGYHPSLLPLHRGRDAIRWAIRMGDRVTGGSVYWLSKNVDGGPIAAQDWCFLPPGTDPGELWREVLQPMGLRLILRTLEDLSRGVVVAVPQDERLATWEPSLDQPPIFRPDLPRIGAPPGFTYVTSAVDPRAAAAGASHQPLGELAVATDHDLRQMGRT